MTAPADEPTLPFAKGSTTSMAAAQSMRKRAETDRARVLAYVRECGDDGATCDEVEVALDLTHQSASARMWDLCGKGGGTPVIRLTSARRRTRSGRGAGVYVHVDARGTP